MEAKIRWLLYIEGNVRKVKKQHSSTTEVYAPCALMVVGWIIIVCATGEEYLREEECID